MDTLVGKTLSHYRILGQIGAGGMGVVYRAHDTQLDRDVAFKLLPDESVGSESARSRLLREARTASALTHPHICHVYEAGQADDHVYIAMELLDGRALSEAIPEGGLPLETILRIGTQIAEALAHAHGKGIIHRDLKANNVIVTPEGRAVVLDFGLAKRELMEGEGSSELLSITPTATGVVMGTPAYLSPEVLQGGRATAQSDIWALGVVLYDMASGELPFHGRSIAELCSAILKDMPAPLPDRVHPGLRAIIQRCLAKESNQRYKLASEVRAALQALQPGSGPVDRRVHPNWGRLAAYAAGVAGTVAMVLLATNVGGWRTRLLTPGHAIRIRSLAVLPLENFSHDPDQQYFADGMTEQLITTLAQIGALRVISRTSVMGFKGTRLAMPEIGRKLGVEAIVEGSVQRSGDRVRVTAQLIRAASDEHMWAQTYERDLRDVLALQDEVAGAIAKQVQAHLTPRQQQKIASARPVSPEGYELYLRALDVFRRWDRRSEQAALEFLKQAIKDDSTYAPAWALTGLVYLQHPGGSGEHEEEVTRARRAVRRALAIDPDLGLAHSVNGVIQHQKDWNWVAAEREFKRAIELSPSLFEAHHSYSHLLMDMGRVEESLEQSRVALALDPLNTAATLHMGWHYLLTGQITEAIAQYEATLRLDPSYAAAHEQLAQAYVLTGRCDEAAAGWRKHVELTGASDSLWMSAIIAAKCGRTDEALRMVSRMVDGVSRGEDEAYDVATVFAVLGRKDDAFRWLDRAIKKRGAGVTTLKRDPFLVALRDDPRFAALLRRLGIPA